MKAISLLFSLLFIVCGPSRAEWSLGLGYPYVTMKYGLSEKTAAEGRFATGGGVNAYAGRLYWNLGRYDRMSVFTGAEVGYVSFDTLDLKGSGYEGSAFAGGEYYFAKNMSLMMDFAPAFIALKSDDYKVSGVEFVVNAGLNFYFGGGQHETSDSEPVKVKQQAAAAVPVKNKEEGSAPADERFIQAEKYADAGDYPKAEAEYRLILKTDSESMEASAGLAGALFKQNKLDEAEQLYLALLDSLMPEDKESVETAERLAGIYVKRGDHRKAIKYFNVAVKLGRKQKLPAAQMFNAHSGLAYCYEKTGDMDMAVSEYEKALECARNQDAAAKIKKRLAVLRKE